MQDRAGQAGVVVYTGSAILSALILESWLIRSFCIVEDTCLDRKLKCSRTLSRDVD